MNRRDILKTTGAIALAALASEAMAAEEHHHHDHSGHADNPNLKLIETASDCIKNGELCVAHCLTLLGEGKTEMVDCARSVHQMLALCGALQQLASYQSTQLKALAKVYMDACKECEDECRKHEKEHKACHDCAESCAACHKACKSLVA